jgi:hypothetical protein
MKIIKNIILLLFVLLILNNYQIINYIITSNIILKNISFDYFITDNFTIYFLDNFS